MEDRSKELPFLDILIKNVNTQIITDIYHKPTDTQQYIIIKEPDKGSAVVLQKPATPKLY